MQYITNINIPLFEGFCRKNQIDGKKIVGSISGVPVKLKVAANEDTKAEGLMNSGEPQDNEGMLFIYDIDEPIQFWMKNVKFPLDILFFDSNMNLINYKTMEPYRGESDENLPRYSSDRPARFAVELRSGWCKDNLKDNCKLKF